MLGLTPMQIGEICYETHRVLKRITHPALTYDPWDDLPDAEQRGWARDVGRLIAGEPYDDRSSWDHLFVTMVQTLSAPDASRELAARAPAEAIAQQGGRIVQTTTGTMAVYDLGGPGHLPPYQGGMLRTLDPAKPTVARIVHYVSYGTPGGEYGRECRAAVVTETGIDKDTLGLAVLNPTGLFFDQAVVLDEGVCMTLPGPDATETATGHAVLCGARSFKGGTWHRPVVG